MEPKLYDFVVAEMFEMEFLILIWRLLKKRFITINSYFKEQSQKLQKKNHSFYNDHSFGTNEDLKIIKNSITITGISTRLNATEIRILY